MREEHRAKYLPTAPTKGVEIPPELITKHRERSARQRAIVRNMQSPCWEKLMAQVEPGDSILVPTFMENTAKQRGKQFGFMTISNRTKLRQNFDAQPPYRGHGLPMCRVWFLARDDGASPNRVTAAIDQLRSALRTATYAQIEEALYVLGFCPSCNGPITHAIDEPFSDCTCGTCEDTIVKLPVIQEMLSRQRYLAVEEATKARTYTESRSAADRATSEPS